MNKNNLSGMMSMMMYAYSCSKPDGRHLHQGKSAYLGFYPPTDDLIHLQFAAQLFPDISLSGKPHAVRAI